MRDYLEIGASPYDEDCVQVGVANYKELATAECRRYIEKLREFFGKEPVGAELKIKANPHDFGTYYEVVCYYDTENEKACKYAFDCESDGPATWDEKPQKERGIEL